MSVTGRFEPDVRYVKSLVGASFSGISKARREARGHLFAPPLDTVAWKSAAAGALVGVAGARLTGNRTPARLAMGGVAGTLLSLAATIAWTSRRFTISAARSAFQSVDQARDAHWLEVNPIDYA